MVLDQRSSDQDSSRTVFFDHSRLLGERGVTAVCLGRDVDGQAILDQVLGEMSRNHKIRSRLLTSLAKAHLRHGNIDQAVDIAIRTGTASSYDDILRLRPELDQWTHTEPVHRLDEALRAS